MSTDEAPIVRTLLRHYVAARALERLTGGSFVRPLLGELFYAARMCAADCMFIGCAYLRRFFWLWLVMFGALIAAGVLV